MIRYERLEVEGEAQRPVKAITDDANAEMAAIDEMLKECEFEGIGLPKERGEDGNFSFEIPGDLVGAFADCAWDIDSGQLEELIEKWNEETIAELGE